MSHPCARAAMSAGQKLFVAVSALAMPPLAAVLLWRPDPVMKVLGVFIAYSAVAAFAAWLSEGRMPAVAIEKEAIRRGEAVFGLDKLRTARLAWRRRAANLWNYSPLLRLDLEGESLQVPLSWPGWWEVWDRLRELRPKLGLPDWRSDPRTLRLIEQRRVRLPPGTRLYGGGFGERAVVGFLVVVVTWAVLLLLQSLLAVSLPDGLSFALAGALGALVAERALPARVDALPPAPPPCEGG